MCNMLKRLFVYDTRDFRVCDQQLNRFDTLLRADCKVNHAESV